MKKESAGSGGKDQVPVGAGAQAFPTFPAGIVKTSGVEPSSAVNKRKGEISMSNAVEMVAGYAVFFVVYLPLVVAYVSGGFMKFVEAFSGSYSGAPNIVKFGEADDY